MLSECQIPNEKGEIIFCSVNENLVSVVSSGNENPNTQNQLKKFLMTEYHPNIPSWITGHVFPRPRSCD